MSVHRFPINKKIEQHWNQQFEEAAERACSIPSKCNSEKDCGEWDRLRSHGGCCRRAVELSASLVHIVALAMARVEAVNNDLLHRILDGKCGGACIEDGCLVIDMWDDDLGEMPQQHNPPSVDIAV